MTGSIGPVRNPDYYIRMQRSHQAENGYYTGGGEPDGIWWNPGGLLGLEHGARVDAQAFYRLCQGYSPSSGEKLTQNAGSEKRSAGLDLTLSADKSVSAVWAVAGEALRASIADAHTAAVQYTLEHVIRAHCATTRIRTRGVNGARGELAIVPAELIAALFQHGTSRADDPQLHTHCTLMNVAKAHFDGRYRALHQYPIYKWKMAAGATYRNHLAWGLRELGFRVEQHGKAGEFTRIAGVPPELEAFWSKRTAQIEAFARENGFDLAANPQLHTAANHLTRAPKRDAGDDDEAKYCRWRTEAQAFSFGEALIAALRHEPALALSPERLRELTDTLERLPERLTREESVFSYPALAAAVQNATAGLLHPGAARTALERVLRSEALVRLSPLSKDHPPEGPRHEVEAGMAHTRLYTTRATLEMEQAVKAMAGRLHHEPGAAMAAEPVEGAIEDLKKQGYRLSDEQASAIRHAATGAGRIALIEGAAGAGKTTTLRPIVDLYRARGYRVLGAAIAWRTALALGSDCAMEALAVRKLLAQAARGQLALDGAPTLLVIDEAGLLSTREMHHLLALGERERGLTLLFAGDTEQQQPIEAGPGLRLVRECIGSVRIDALRRQRADIEDILAFRHAQAPERARRIAAAMPEAERRAVLAEHERSSSGASAFTPWQITASAAFRDGRAGEALKAYHERGRVHLCPDDEAALARLVADWAGYERDNPGKTAAVLARTNAERRALSERMREVHLPPSDKRTALTVPVHHRDRGKAPVPLDIAVGERLRIGATHWEKGLFNGSIVTVETLEPRKPLVSGETRVRITGRTDTGRAVSFHHDEICDYHGHIRLDHGYALTIASAQGLTADRIFLYADAKPARQTLYPAATRHRERLDFYIDRRPLVLDIIARDPEDASSLEVTDDALLGHLGERWSRGAPKVAALDYPALPAPQYYPRPGGEEEAARRRPAVALDRAVARAARVFRVATLEFRHGSTVRAVSAAREALLERYEGLRERERQEGNTVALTPEFRQTLTEHKALLETARPLRARAATLQPLLERRGRIKAGDLDELEALYQRAARYRRSAVASRARSPEAVEEARRRRGAEAQAQREAEAEAQTQAQRQLAAALAPYAESLCRRYLPEGVKRDGQWRVRLVADDKDYAVAVALAGSERGAWTVEAVSGRGALLDSFRRHAVPVLPLAFFEPEQAAWKDRVAGAPGNLVDLIHNRGHHRALAGAMAEARAFLEGESKARLDSQYEAQRQLAAALAPYAEVLCRRHLPEGVKRDGQWRVRLVADDKDYAMAVALSGPERGAWRLEAAGGQGALLDIVHRVHKGMESARALFTDGAQDRPMDIPLAGPGQAMWRDKLAGEPGNLFDLIRHSAGGEITQAIAAARAFLEAEVEARRQLAAALIPHTEALCRRCFPSGAEQDGQWPFRIRRGERAYSAAVQLSGPERGTWTDEATGEPGDLLDLIRLADKHEHITEAMAAARAFLDGEQEARRQLNAELALHAEALYRRCLPDSIPPVGLLDALRGAWKNDLTGEPGDLLDLIHSRGKHRDLAGAMAEARTFLEGEYEARRQLAAALAPHAEAVCESYLPGGVKRGGQWRAERLTVRLSGPKQGTWKNDLTGEPGDLLDIVCIYGQHDRNMIRAMDAARAFIEGEYEAQRQLAAALAPHAEALCQRYFPSGAEQDGQWRAAHTVLDARECSVSVQLSGPERGAWVNETTGEQGELLLDLVYRTGKHDTLAAAMAAGRAFIDEHHEAERLAQAQAQREAAHRQRTAQREARRLAKAHRAAQAALLKEWKAHHALAPSADDARFDNPQYRHLIRRTRDLAEEHANLQAPSPFHAVLKQRLAEDQVHETACRPLRRHVGAVHAHTGKRERLQRQENFYSPPVFNDQYPQWRRDAKALIAAGQKLLKTSDSAQLAATTWLGKVEKATAKLEKTVHDDSDYFQARIKRANAHLARHAETVCRRYFPQGVKQGGQWRAHIDRGEHTDAVSVQLSGPERGTWKNETTGERGEQLLDLVYRTGKYKTVRETLDAAYELDRELSDKISHKISPGYSMKL